MANKNKRNMLIRNFVNKFDEKAIEFNAKFETCTKDGFPKWVRIYGYIFLIMAPIALYAVITKESGLFRMALIPILPALFLLALFPFAVLFLALRESILDLIKALFPINNETIDKEIRRKKIYSSIATIIGFILFWWYIMGTDR